MLAQQAFNARPHLSVEPAAGQKRPTHVKVPAHSTIDGRPAVGLPGTQAPRGLPQVPTGRPPLLQQLGQPARHLLDSQRVEQVVPPGAGNIQIADQMPLLTKTQV